MKRHVEDVLSGGGVLMNPFYGTLNYMKDEFNLRLRFCVLQNYNPQNVCEIEQKLYDYLEGEKVIVGVSLRVPCEAFITSYKGCTAIVMPTDAEYRKDQVDRLVALAHEIGHYIDFKFNHDFGCESYDSKDDHARILSKEVIAWTYAYDILEALGFDKWDEFLFKMKDALLSYFKDERKEEVLEHVSGIRKMLRKQG